RELRSGRVGRLESQKDDGAGHLLGGAVALHRRHGIANLVEDLALLIRHAGDARGGRLDETGTDDVDTYASRQKLGGQTGGEGPQRSLGCAVDAHAGLSTFIGDG